MGGSDDRRRVQALWYEGPGRAALRSEEIAAPAEGEALVRMSWSAISRGTERLIFSGLVPASEYDRMRAPFQVGQFPFPVKYGYCAVGRVACGPPAMLGKHVFCLHPHQTAFVVPVNRLMQLPSELPARRAILAANMETALNALWDSGAGPGDRIAVVGAGIVGLLVAYLAARLPGSDVTVIDRDPARERIVRDLGGQFAVPKKMALEGADVVFHASATAAGLATAIECAGLEARVVELSWYGEGDMPVRLGGAFHSQRLTLLSSQVGQVAPSRRPRWPYARRLAKALELLTDSRLDALVTAEVAFEALPDELPGLLAPGASGLVTAVHYHPSEEQV